MDRRFEQARAATLIKGYVNASPEERKRMPDRAVLDAASRAIDLFGVTHKDDDAVSYPDSPAAGSGPQFLPPGLEEPRALGPVYDPEPRPPGWETDRDEP